MKKLLSAIAILTMTTISCVCFAQDLGVNDVIFEGNPTSQNLSTTDILPNNISFDLVKKHLVLAKIVGPASPTDDALITLKNLEDLVKTDIIQALTLAQDKKTTVVNYLTESDLALEKGNSVIISLRQELALIKLDMNACQVDKNSADKEYFQGINTYDNQSSQRALNQSIANEKCATENRIQYNAKGYLLDKIVFFESVLKQRYDLISKEQDIIINHFEVISTTLIQKLQTINEVLNAYQF